MLSELRRRVFRSAPLVIAGQVTFAVSAVVAARTFESDAFSLYSTQLYLSALVATGAAGIQLDAAHEYANQVDVRTSVRTSRYLKSLLMAGTLMGLGATATLPLLGAFWNAPWLDLVGLPVIPMSALLFALAFGALQGVRSFRAMFALSLFVGGWRIFALLIAKVFQINVGSIILITVSGPIVAVVIFAPLVNQYRMQVQSILTTRLLVLTTSSISLWVLIYVDLLTLRRLSGEFDAGAVSALLVISKGLMTLPLLIGQLMFPDMADRQVAAPEKARALRRIVWLVSGLGIALAFVIVVSAPFVLSKVFGFGESQIPRYRTIALAAVAVIPGAVAIVVGNVAMATISKSFALISSIVATATLVIGVSAANTIDQLLAVSIGAPLLLITCVFALRQRVLAFSRVSNTLTGG
ncbi:MAG: hypothetical protein ACO3JF_09805 [Ilumatobacteraceae bacterium]